MYVLEAGHIYEWSFPLRISSVNVIKSPRNYGWSYLLKKSLMENFIFFCTVTNIPLEGAVGVYRDNIHGNQQHFGKYQKAH